MYRHRSFLPLCLLAAISAAQAATPQEDQKIHPPKWAIGVWQNLAESDTRRIVTLEVSNKSIRISRGLQSPAADLLGLHPDRNIKESAQGNTYRIEFRKDGRVELLELMFHPSDPGAHGPAALTYYSGSPPVPLNAHSTSINFLLVKMAELDATFMRGK